MFTLRRITQQGVQINQVIGDSYSYINREANYEEFCRAFETHFKKPHVADLDEKADSDTKECYAFICNGGFWQPLYKKQKNFVMTGEGKTYANVTFK